MNEFQEQHEDKDSSFSSHEDEFDMVLPLERAGALGYKELNVPSLKLFKMKNPIHDDNREKYRAMKAVHYMERLDVRRSHIHGWGLYLKRDVKRHEFIVEYVGEIVRLCVGDKRERYYDECLGVGSCYLFRLDTDNIVDATRRGSVARFINHCCKPNAYAKVVNLDSQLKKIVIVALTDLNAGDEVMYDYKFAIEDEKIPCSCGAPNCKGVMN